MSISSIHSLPVTIEERDEYLTDSALGPMNRDSYSIHKHRKSASTGGGRAWTEDEESYLLRSRTNKMPYKHIAAHLHKTELACRLHYHQMSYGSNRRKRNGSISSTCSSSSFNPLSVLRESSPENMRYTSLSPVNSPPSSPESATTALAPVATISPAMSQRPILPKPMASDSRPMLPSSVELSKALQLDTSFAPPNDLAPRHNHVDVAKLRALYAANRESFWGHIAAQYSSPSAFTAAEMETAFFNSQPLPRLRGSSPPTPGPSPQSSSLASFGAQAQAQAQARVQVQVHEQGGFNAINRSYRRESVSGTSPTERCAVRGLLN